MKFWTHLLISLLVIPVVSVLSISCSSTGREDDKKWIDQTFYDIAYRVPASWEVIRTSDSVQYGRPGVRMNTIKIERFEKGETLPDTRFTVDPNREIWSYADEQVEILRNEPGVLEVNRKKQEVFPPLGNSFYSKVYAKNVRAIDRVYWFIGALIDSYYYLVTVEVERHSHLPAVKEAFLKFKASLQLKSQKEEKSS